MLEPVKIRQFDFCCLMQFCVCSGLEAALAWAVQVVLAVPAALPVLPWTSGVCGHGRELCAGDKAVPMGAGAQVHKDSL